MKDKNTERKHKRNKPSKKEGKRSNFLICILVDRYQCFRRPCCFQLQTEVGGSSETFVAVYHTIHSNTAHVPEIGLLFIKHSKNRRGAVVEDTFPSAIPQLAWDDGINLK